MSALTQATVLGYLPVGSAYTMSANTFEIRGSLFVPLLFK